MYGKLNQDPLDSLELFTEFLRDYLEINLAATVRDISHAVASRSRISSHRDARGPVSRFISELTSDEPDASGEFSSVRVSVPRLPKAAAWHNYDIRVPQRPDVLVSYHELRPGLPYFVDNTVRKSLLWLRPLKVERFKRSGWGFHFNDASKTLNLTVIRPPDHFFGGIGEVHPTIAAYDAAAHTIRTLSEARQPNQVTYVATRIVCQGRDVFDAARRGVSHGEFVDRLFASAVRPDNTPDALEYSLNTSDAVLCTLASCISALGFLRECARLRISHYRPRVLNEFPYFMLTFGDDSDRDRAAHCYLGNAASDEIRDFLERENEYWEMKLW